MLDRVADRAAGEIGGVGERRLSGSDPEGKRGRTGNVKKRQNRTPRYPTAACTCLFSLLSATKIKQNVKKINT